MVRGTGCTIHAPGSPLPRASHHQRAIAAVSRSAFGEHAGDHLGIASIGSIVPLVLPPVLLILFMWAERGYLVVIAHDFDYAMDG